MCFRVVVYRRRWVNDEVKRLCWWNKVVAMTSGYVLIGQKLIRMKGWPGFWIIILEMKVNNTLFYFILLILDLFFTLISNNCWFMLSLFFFSLCHFPNSLPYHSFISHNVIVYLPFIYFILSIYPSIFLYSHFNFF